MSLPYIISGLKIIAKPGIRQFVIIPLIINCVLFAGLLLLTNHYFHIIESSIMHRLPSWLEWLGSALWLIFVCTFFMIFIHTFTLASNLVAAPFNSLLAEKVEQYITGQTSSKSTSAAENLCQFQHSFIRQLNIIRYYFIRALPLSLLFFIPVFQPIAAIAWLLFSAWFMTLQYLDYPIDNHQISLPQLLTAMKKNTSVSLSFGFGVMVLSTIPFVNILTMPAAIAGATKAWVEVYQRK